MIEKLTCSTDVTLFEALRQLDENGKGTLFLVTPTKELVGILTDGDIRRCLLNGIELSDKVDTIMNTEFSSAIEGTRTEDLLKLLSDVIRIIPIVNSENQLVDFFQYDGRMYIPVATPNLAGNEFKYLVDAFLSTWISSSGTYIDQFEEGFSKFCGTEHGIAVSNGTVALHLSMVALGIGEGDEVIVPDLTFAASINTVLHANATPVIVDVEEESWCIDPKAIEQAITPRTKAIMPVHVYGQPCDMDPIMEIARIHNLYVIEDAAEAHGATYKGKRVGSIGDVGCFSFFGNKVMTTGEGGMCITNSKELDEKMRLLRDHGMSKSKRYWHDHVGYNYRLTNMQAAVGVAQLERIENILLTKNGYEQTVKDLLEGVDHVDFQNDKLAGRNKIVWLTCILITNGKRDEYMNTLKENGIDARPFFYPLSSMPVYSKYSSSECPISRKISRLGLNLPSSSPIPSESLDIIRSIISEAQ